MLGSRIPYPVPHVVDLIRRTKKQSGGRVIEGASVKVYENVPARISQFRETEVTSLGKPSSAGMVADNQFKVGLGGIIPTLKIVSGDYVRVYWGTPPNVVSPLGVPNGFPPQIMLKDTELQILSWSNSPRGWVGETYSIVYEGGTWVLLDEGTQVASFGTNENFPLISCSDFPEGLQFVRFTGKPLDLKIIQVRHKVDETGNWHHTTLITEYSETDSGVRI